jgi:hypothetical protein
MVLLRPIECAALIRTYLVKNSGGLLKAASGLGETGIKMASLTLTSVGLSRQVRTRTKFALGFAMTGFLIGVGLCAYTFYVISSHYKGPPPSAAVYLVLCPFSFASLALDNAGVVGGLVGWLFISIMNAAFYGVLGLGIGERVERGQR